MRAFVAIDVPDELREQTADLARLLARSVDGRFVPRENYHVTVAFLGEIDEAEAAAAVAALDVVGRVAAPPAEVDEVRNARAEVPLEAVGLGSFREGKTRTLYLALRRDPGLMQLAEDVREELRARGLSFDEKGFLPHVTLARRARMSVDNLGELAFPLPARASRLTLYRSLLARDGATYKPLYSIEL
jgi:2'-5' RNA ligase